MDIGNLEGVDSSSSRGVNVMKAGSVIVALAMVVIGCYASYDPNGAAWDKETLASVFEVGKELIQVLLGM
ncbi:hypothetical protein D3C86_2081640 [compost metagenome]